MGQKRSNNNLSGKVSWGIFSFSLMYLRLNLTEISGTFAVNTSKTAVLKKNSMPF